MKGVQTMNSYQILTGREANEEIVEQALELDKLVYPAHYHTILSYALSWYRKNKDIFVFLLDGQKPIGYICLLPLSEQRYEEIRKGIVAQDMTTSLEDVLAYQSGLQYNLYIFSTVLHPEYHGGDGLPLLLQAIKNTLTRLESEGVGFKKVLADTVSPKGVKLAQSLGFMQVCSSNHDSIIQEADFNLFWQRLLP